MIKRICIVCFLLVWAAVSAYPLDFETCKNNWKILTDSGWRGASSGSIEKPGKSVIRFNYALKAAESWPWPEIDFLVNFDIKEDLREYKGVEITIKGKQEEEVYFYFLVEDKKLGILKPSLHRLLIKNTYRKIYLPFSRFKIGADWIPRNPGFNASIEWDRVRALGFHKKGRDGEKGSLYLKGIRFMRKGLPKAVDLEKSRGLPPKHGMVNFKKRRPEKNINAELAVYASRKGGRISPYLYGANWGVWLNLPDKNKVSPLNLKLIRAGGPFMDRYNWRTGGYTFPGNKKRIMMTGMDDFIEYCHEIGAEPIIQINALGCVPDEQGGKALGKSVTDEDAADLIRYLNKEKKYNVRFFEIGSEPFIWHNVHYDAREKPCSMEEYFESFKKISISMKKAQAEIDPASEIKIFAPAISTSWSNWGTLAPEDAGKSVIPYFLKKCHEYQNDKIANPEGIRILDVLSFHLFPLFREPGTGSIQENTGLILRSTRTWWDSRYINKYDYSLPLDNAAGVLPQFKKWIAENYPGTELAVTEFNIESESMAARSPVIKVLYLADLYGIIGRYNINYAAQFCLNSSDHKASLIDDTDYITPLYYPLYMYSNYFKGYILDSESSLPGGLDIHAAKNKNEIVAMVINKEKRLLAASVTIKNDGKTGDGTVFFKEFPGLSLTCLRLFLNDNKNVTGEYWEYGEHEINGAIHSRSDLQ